VNDLFRKLNQLISGKSIEAHGPAKKGEQLRSVIDHALITTTLGWKPSVSLDEGLRRTVEYFHKTVKR